MRGRGMEVAIGRVPVLSDGERALHALQRVLQWAAMAAVMRRGWSVMVEDAEVGMKWSE